MKVRVTISAVFDTEDDEATAGKSVEELREILAEALQDSKADEVSVMVEEVE